MLDAMLDLDKTKNEMGETIKNSNVETKYVLWL